MIVPTPPPKLLGKNKLSRNEQLFLRWILFKLKEGLYIKESL